MKHQIKRQLSNTRNSFRHFFRRIRWLAFGGLIGLSVVSLIYAIPLATVQNTANVTQAGVPSVATGNFSSSTICNASSGLYGSTATLAWGNVSAGTVQTRFICLQNTGSGSYRIPTDAQLNATMCSGCGTVTSPQATLIVGPRSFLLVELDWSVSPNILGAQSWTITFS